MSALSRQLSSQFRSHWIGVKFYKQKPRLKDVVKPEGIRFCEATKRAILDPVLLDKQSITCPGAHFAFGWISGPTKEDELLDSCQDKRNIQKNTLQSMISGVHHFNTPFECIGLNTDDEPDLMMSYLVPEEAMKLIRTYHNNQRKNLDISVCSMMSICGGIAVRTFLDNQISFSFGCDDSRKYAEIGRDRLAVGIPKELFKIFVD